MRQTKKNISAVLVVLMAVFSMALSLFFASAARADEKVRTPSIEKLISLDGENWDKVVSASILDTLYYRIEIALPETLNEFDYYPLSIEDVLPQSETIDSDSIDARLVSDEGYAQKIALSTTTTNNRVSFFIDDILPLEPEAVDRVVVTYSAKVEPGCVIGDPGNVNYVRLGYHAEADSIDIVYTPESAAVAVVYGLRVTVYETGKPEVLLPGTQFVIRDIDGRYVDAEYGWVYDRNSGVLPLTNAVGAKAIPRVLKWTDRAHATIFTANEQGQFEVMGIGPGQYIIEQTKTLDGYILPDELYQVTLSPTPVFSVALNEAVDEGIPTGVVDVLVDNPRSIIPQPATPEPATPEQPTTTNTPTGRAPQGVAQIPQASREVTVQRLAQTSDPFYAGMGALAGITCAGLAFIVFGLIKRGEQDA